MMLINSELAERCLQKASLIKPYPPMIVKKTNLRIEVYEVVLGNNSIILGEKEDHFFEQTFYYWIDKTELGVDIITDPEWSKVINEGKEVLGEVVETLKSLKEGE